jgi:replicative DNA helicase
MASVQLITRLISSETGLSSELRTGKLEKHEWEQLVSNLEKAPLFIDDTPSLSIFDLRRKPDVWFLSMGFELLLLTTAVDDRRWK